MASRPDASRLPAASLPHPRDGSAPYRIALVCLGNICRSPIGEVVLRDMLGRAGLADRVTVVSAGTGGWHVGNAMDARAAAVLTEHGYDPSRHRARQFGAALFEECDLILAMDGANFDEIAALHAPQSDDSGSPRVRMFRDFDPRARDDDRNVPDPYYGGDEGFHSVLAMVERTASGIVEAHGRRSDED